MTTPPVVLIPALNAEDSIREVVTASRAAVIGAAVLVVDDGSTDGTSAKATQAGARVIRHPANAGKGAALRTGFHAVLREYPCDVVVTLDADWQHDPAEIPKLLAAFENDDASIVVGKRDRWRTAMPLSRKLSNTITSFLVTARTGIPIADSQCGFRVISRSVVERITIDANGFEAETEFLIKAAQNGFRISSVPVRTVYRGEPSSMTYWVTTREFVKTLFRDY